MDHAIWWLLLVVVSLVVGPLAALRAAAHFRSRRPLPPPLKDDAENDWK